MKATIMDGKALAEEIKAHIKDEVNLMKNEGIVPSLVTILVGGDQASKIYLRSKHKACGEVGISSRNVEVPESTSSKDLSTMITELNEDDTVHGILVQMPLPNHLDSFDAICSLSPDKDVDGLHPWNMGSISYKIDELVPCTPKGILALLAKYKIGIAGKHVVVINRSTLVGRPISSLLRTINDLPPPSSGTDMMLLNQDATVTTCHSKTVDLLKYIRDADILITAVGMRPEFTVTDKMVKNESVIIDVAMNRVQGNLCGDVDFERVIEKVSYITPVPGGVGPMTVAMLLHNTIIAASKVTRYELSYNTEEMLRSIGG